MKRYLDFLPLVIAVAIVLLVGFSKPPEPVKAPSQDLGASLDVPTVVALFETSLASAISSTATSFTLTSAADLTGTALASSTYAFIIDEGTASQELVIADCTSTACANAQRGISVVTGTTTVAALEHSHRRGASVKITDGPQLNILSRIVNGVGTFPNKISYKSAPVFTSGLDIIDKTYADNLIIAGGTAGSDSVPGIFLTGTQVQVASTTSSGTYLGQPYLKVIPASMATSSPGTAGLWAVITNNAGKIAQAFFDWSASIAFSGNNTHAGTETMNATTTIAASSVTNNALVLNGLAYKFPGARNASSTVLITDAVGNLYWDGVPAASYVGATIATSTSNSTASVSWSQDYAYTTGFAPTTIILYLRGNSNHNGTASYTVSTNAFQGTSCTGGLVLKPESTVDTMIPSATSVGCALRVGSESFSGEYFDVSISAVTSTGFTVRVTRTGTGTVTWPGADVSISPVAYR